MWLGVVTLASPFHRWTLPALERFALRPLALTLAVFWSLQVLVCLASPTHAVASEHHGATASPASHEHYGSAVQSPSEGHPAEHSQPATPDDHHGSDGGCTQHCASLTQTLTASAAAVPLPSVSLVAIIPTATSSDLARALVGAVARLELERPPPDLLARHSTLRI